MSRAAKVHAAASALGSLVAALGDLLSHLEATEPHRALGVREALRARATVTTELHALGPLDVPGRPKPL